jgi:hypothetical protein
MKAPPDDRFSDGPGFGPAAEALARRVRDGVREHPGLALATAFGLGAALALAPQRWVAAALAAGARLAVTHGVLGTLDLRGFVRSEADAEAPPRTH